MDILMYARLARVGCLLCMMIASLMPVEAMEKTQGDGTEAVLDLSGWSFERAGDVRLSSGWTVFRGQIVPPSSIDGSACTTPPGVSMHRETGVSAPDVWGPAFTATVASGHGSATYCRSLILPSDGEFHALRTGTLRSVSAVYALYENADGDRVTRLLYRNGDPATTVAANVNNPAPPLITLPFGVSRLSLVIQVANHIHKQGGMIEVPVIDVKWRLESSQNRATALPSALVIVLFLVSLGTFVIGVRQTNKTGHILFAFLTAASALRVMLVSDIIWDYFPSFPLERKYDLEYLTLFLLAPAYYKFITFLFRGRSRHAVDYVVYGVSCVMAVFALFFAPFFPPGTITLVREPIQALWAVIAVGLGFTIFRANIKGEKHTEEAVVVITAALVTVAYEILSVAGVIGASLEWSQFLIVFVTLMHARAFVVNSRRIEQERDALMQRLRTANRALEDRAVALDSALLQAEEASRAKSNFIATISHELRTPLNAIIGFSELIMRKTFGPVGDPHYEEYAQDIHESGNHLLSIVNDILDLSRIEAGTEELTEKLLKVPDVVRSVLTIVGPQAETLKVTCRMECTTVLPLLYADERKLKQILFNLIANAIKFNKEGGEVVATLSAGKDGFHIEIRDTGIGMHPEEIPTALMRFGQLDSKLGRKYNGIGLGLPLSQGLVELHGGKMHVFSSPGEGTAITLIFPPERCQGIEQGDAEAGL